uniref:JAB1/MPN/MOV34 metalloenzyme domain-containing protein n=1 Tax=Geospiza parvula TaxID=87175 RepID=A0A8C3MUE0_GEOPR
MAVQAVHLEADAFLVCLNHALSTEKEEVMGLCIGEVDTNRIVHIHSVIILRRSDKRKDRVEISPEQLSAASTEAEISFSRDSSWLSLPQSSSHGLCFRPAEGLKLSAAPCCSCSAGRAVLAVAFPWSLCWFQCLQWNCVINFLSLLCSWSQVKLQCVCGGGGSSAGRLSARGKVSQAPGAALEPLLCTHSRMLLWTAAEMFVATCKQNLICFCSSNS